MPAPQSPHDQPGLPILIVRFGHVDEVLRGANNEWTSSRFASEASGLAA